MRLEKPGRFVRIATSAGEAGSAKDVMLSEIEILCLALVAQGHSPRSIAGRADVPLAAIARQIEEACRKLDARNTLHAVAKACRLELLPRNIEP